MLLPEIAPALVTTARTESTGAGGAPATVLLVEDDDGVRRLARRVLERAGFSVVEAEDGKAALARAGELAGDLAAVVTDVRMPGLSGPALVKEVLRDRPEVPVLFMSGYSEDLLELDHAGTAPPRRVFLQKPFTPSSLVDALHEVMTSAAP